MKSININAFEHPADCECNRMGISNGVQRDFSSRRYEIIDAALGFVALVAIFGLVFYVLPYLFITQ
jgi:hypothetical protein